MLVHIINKHGKPLMPCSPRKARLLLKNGKAEPYKGKTGHFTIQLLYGSSGYKQEIVLGIDTGAKRVPIAAVANGKALYAKEKILRTDVKKRLLDRRGYRRSRRNRLRYRKPRFDNRTKTKCSRCGVNNVPKAWKTVKRKNGDSRKKVGSGRVSLCRKCQGKKGMDNRPFILPPSVKNRAESILHDIEKLSVSLPISSIVVETASFDTQRMFDPEIQGEEYQQGTLFGTNVWYYLINLFGNKCAYCGGLSGVKSLQLEHVVPRSKDGTDKVSNLVVACRKCNEDKGSMLLSQWERALELQPESPLRDRRLKNISRIEKRSYLKKGFQYSALTQSYKNFLLHELRESYQVKETTGARTKYHRELLDLPKSQINDAIVIASEGQEVELPDTYILEKQLKKRRPAQFISSPQKGVPITKRKWNSELFGFRLWDRVECEGQVGYVGALRASGSFRIHNLESSQIFGGKSYRKLELLRACRSNYVREINPIIKSRMDKRAQEPRQMLLPFD